MNLQGEEDDVDVNVQGETVKKLDVLSNDAMIEFLRRSTVVSLMVSEENEEAITVPEHPKAKYCVAFDPLDGSSNIDVNITIGTIFTVFRKQGPADEPATVKDILQTGRVPFPSLLLSFFFFFFFFFFFSFPFFFHSFC